MTLTIPDDDPDYPLPTVYDLRRVWARISERIVHNEAQAPGDADQPTGASLWRLQQMRYERRRRCQRWGHRWAVVWGEPTQFVTAPRGVTGTAITVMVCEICGEREEWQ